MVPYLSNKCTMNTISQTEAEIQLVVRRKCGGGSVESGPNSDCRL